MELYRINLNYKWIKISGSFKNNIEIIIRVLFK